MRVQSDLNVEYGFVDDLRKDKPHPIANVDSSMLTSSIRPIANCFNLDNNLIVSTVSLGKAQTQSSVLQVSFPSIPLMFYNFSVVRATSIGRFFLNSSRGGDKFFESRMQLQLLLAAIELRPHRRQRFFRRCTYNQKLSALKYLIYYEFFR